ncbi:MAG: hypothetical protein NTY02_13480, partial [Acidobacteria bacterium]|nr:hypothetical protein [Acidobacteriota bacterium]
LDLSVREYVKASMLIQALDAWGVLGSAGQADGTVFDISVGYDLAGIRSEPMRRWLASMRDASAIVDAVRAEIPDEFAGLRDLPYRTNLSSGVTLSTFHGTPAGEIERIGEFLIDELGLHTVIKLNPPMLGRARVEHILHEVLGYHDVQVNPGCYERSLPFDEALDMMGRLRALGARRGVGVGVKCGNTLEVVNAGTFLKESVQYLSGQPLHALHAALSLQWREACGPSLQISFSAGVDARNVTACIAAGLVPVTTCTDLLRAGGYGRLSRYLTNLEGRMRELHAATIPDFVRAVAPGVDDPVRHNARALLDQALGDQRYRSEQNRKAPRKLGTRLWLWDCVSCSKCVPACPNDAVFEVDAEPFLGDLPVIEVTDAEWREVDRRLYRAMKPTQIVIFADACNECGNCDVFCPEDGGPYLEKPRLFGSEDSWRLAAPLSGYLLVRDGQGFAIRGRLDGGEFALSRPADSDVAVMMSGAARLEIDWHTHEIRSARLRGSANPARVDLAHYMTLRLLMDALLRPGRIHFINALFVE